MPPLNRIQKTGIALAISQVLSHGAQAATMTVDNLGDAGEGCTLREAIERINLSGTVSNGCSARIAAFGTRDTIDFAIPGTIVLGSEGQLRIEKSVVINASTVSGVTIDANQNSRVMRTANETSVTLTNLTLTGGRASGNGGAILAGADGELTIMDSTVTDNKATNFGGGLHVIFSSSSSNNIVNIVNSEFSNNMASTVGGAIHLEQYAGNTLTLTNSIIVNNVAARDGGGIYSLSSDDVIILNDSEVMNNTAGSAGGGIYLEEGSLALTNTTISGNSSASSGGGVKGGRDSSITVINSTISGNSAAAGGGGIYADSLLTLTSSKVMNNTAGSGGGGIDLGDGILTLTNTTISGNSSINDGGGVHGSYESSITVINSTISGNSTAGRGGGIYADSNYSLTLTNSTVSGNTADKTGGGIFTRASTTLLHTTVANNTNGIGFFGAGVYSTGELTLTNSILADSIGGEDCYSRSSLIADAQSIVEDGNCGARSGDPGLLPLANNGGPTLTHALASNSIAINTGDNASCLAADQRGEPRSDGRCDVGAFEFLDDGGFFVIPLKNGKVVVIPE